MTTTPLIVDIKRDSHEDGPGIRSVVFFKGCPLRCVFCHNPESQETWFEIAFSNDDCLNCGKCAEVCESGAIDLARPGRIERDKCLYCGDCIKACANGALKQIGQEYPSDVLTELLLEDEAFYRSSGGGVTFSGGECATYPDYLEGVLKGLKEKDIHIAVETAGYFNYEAFQEKILPHLDLIYYDVKFVEPELHRKYTGRSNELILKNLERLVSDIDLLGSDTSVQARVPLIPGITTSRENLAAIVGFLKDVGVEEVSLLPYNPLGLDMLPKIGREPSVLPKGFMKPEDEKEVFLLFETVLKETYGDYDFQDDGLQED